MLIIYYYNRSFLFCQVMKVVGSSSTPERRLGPYGLDLDFGIYHRSSRCGRLVIVLSCRCGGAVVRPEHGVGQQQVEGRPAAPPGVLAAPPEVTQPSPAGKRERVVPLRCLFPALHEL